MGKYLFSWLRPIRSLKCASSAHIKGDGMVGAALQKIGGFARKSVLLMSRTNSISKEAKLSPSMKLTWIKSNVQRLVLCIIKPGVPACSLLYRCLTRGMNRTFNVCLKNLPEVWMFAKMQVDTSGRLIQLTVGQDDVRTLRTKYSTFIKGLLIKKKQRLLKMQNFTNTNICVGDSGSTVFSFRQVDHTCLWHRF